MRLEKALPQKDITLFGRAIEKQKRIIQENKKKCESSGTPKVENYLFD